jgi:predicted HTH domain antitoxin
MPEVLSHAEIELLQAISQKEAIRLYAAGEISQGRAAELAGMNYFLFEEILRKQGVKVVEPINRD